MTVLLTLSSSPVWHSIVANTSFKKVERACDFTTSESSLCVVDAISFEELVELLSSKAHVTLCYESPASSLARAIMLKDDYKNCIEEQIFFYTKLLSLHRKSRRNMTLVNLSQLANSDSDVLNKTGLFGTTGTFSTSELYKEKLNSVGTLIALKAIEQNEELQSICESLQASSTNIVENDNYFDIATLVQNEKDQQKCRKDLENTNQNLHSKYKISSEKLDDITSDNELLRQSITELQQLTDNNEQKLAQLHDSLSKSRGEAHQAQILSSELLAEKSLLEKDVATLQSELDNRNRRLAEKDEALEISEARIDSLTEIENELKADVEILHNTILSIQEEYTLKSATAINLESALRDEKVNSSSVKEALEFQLLESKAENSLLQSSLTTLSDNILKLEAITEEAERLKLAVDESGIIKESLEGKIRELLSEKERFEALISKLQREKGELKSNNLRETKRLKREVAQLKSKNEKTLKELLNSTDKLRNVEYELNKIKSSTAWRLSAPARAVSKKLKREDAFNEALKQDVGLLYTSTIFDVDWYLTTYPDVKEAGIDPAEHYLIHGAKEGRLPCASFDGDWYLRQYKDVAESGLNPLVHYIKYGMAEGRTISPKLLRKD